MIPLEAFFFRLIISHQYEITLTYPHAMNSLKFLSLLFPLTKDVPLFPLTKDLLSFPLTRPGTCRAHLAALVETW